MSSKRVFIISTIVTMIISCTLVYGGDGISTVIPLIKEIKDSKYKGFRSIKVSNGTLTDDGGGSFTIETGSGSGSGTVNGTTNYVAKFTNTTVVGNSDIWSNGNIGIGTTSPQAKLGVVGDIIADLNTSPATSSLTGTAISARGADNSQVRIATSSYGAAGIQAFAGRHARGTAASASAVNAGDVLVGLEGWGYGATGYSVAPSAMIRSYSAETWTDTAQGAYMKFWTTGAGTSIPSSRMVIDSTGNVVVGTTAITASAILATASTTKGSLPAPAMTQAQRDLIATPAAGLQVYNTDSKAYNYYDGTSWTAIGSGAAASSGLQDILMLGGM